MNDNTVLKTYRGTPGDAKVLVYPLDGEPYQLRHIVYHSPDGFAWGYGGSGPADLALSILADHLGECSAGEDPWLGNPQCWRYYQPFKFDFVANWPMDVPFELHSEEIDAWLGAAMLAKQRQDEDGWLESAYDDTNGGLEEC